MIANGLTIDEIRTSIGADSLGYVSLEELIEATTIPAEKLCRACFDGIYPVPIPDPQVVSTQVMEGIERRVNATSNADGHSLVKNEDGRS